MFDLASSGVTWDDAIQIAVIALAEWHHRDHGEHCVCSEAECFGFQAVAVINALVAARLALDAFEAPGFPHPGHPASRSGPSAWR